MIRDIWCVAWKELMMVRRNLKSYYTNYIFVLIMWGMLIPASMVDSIRQGEVTMSLLVFGYLSVFLASGHTISAFVGERMQKTLGTLLTTRLSDAAIYLGKVVAIMLISYAVMLLVLGFHLGSVWYVSALKLYPSRFPYTPIQLVFMLVLPVLSLLYTSSLGVFISLKTTNIRSQHFLNLFMGVPVFVGFFYLLKSLTWERLLVGMVVFALVSVAITAVSIGRFNRQRLILQ
jgi:hypothetical protein